MHMSLEQDACTANVLNDDVLAVIFEFLAQYDPPRVIHKDSRTCRMDLGFMRTSHVCRHWRGVLLSLSSIWSQHIFAFPQPAAVFTVLERAKLAPLHLDRLYLRPQTLQVLHHAVPRAKTLDISTQRSTISLDDFADLVRTLCTQDTWQLERAKLVYEPLNGALLLCDATNAQPTMSAPRLQHLTLINTFFPFELPALTHLTLRWQPKPDARLSAALLLAGLRASPLLESLSLSHALCDGLLAEPISNSPRIRLPQLTRLAVKDESPLVFALASLIAGAPELHFDAELVDDSPEGTAGIDGLSSQFRRVLAHAPNAALSISHIDYFMRLKLLPIPAETPLHAAHATAPPLGSIQWRSTPAGPGLVVTFSGRAWDQFAEGEPGTAFRRLLRGAVRGLRAHAEQVKAVELLPRASVEPSADEWVECLAPLSSLRTLACAPLDGLMGALADTDPEVFLPRLSSLAVNVGEVIPGLQSVQRLRAQSAENRVLSAVEARAEAGYPVTRVRVEGDMNAEVLGSLLARLQVNVPHVQHFTNSVVCP